MLNSGLRATVMVLVSPRRSWAWTLRPLVFVPLPPSPRSPRCRDAGMGREKWVTAGLEGGEGEGEEGGEEGEGRERSRKVDRDTGGSDNVNSSLKQKQMNQPK